MHISHELVRFILVDILGIRRVSARIVLKELNFLQKQYREQVSLGMLDPANSNPTFMERIITGMRLGCMSLTYKQVSNNQNGGPKRSLKTKSKSLEGQGYAHRFL